MNPANMGTLRARSPSRSRRTSSVDPEGRPIPGASQRHRHFSGPDGHAHINGGASVLEGDSRYHQAGGSWGGVNESEEDLRRSFQSPQPVRNGSPTLDREEKFRRRLAFFFMDPVQKFQARRQVPWKLSLQFLKILVVTIQVGIFGNFRYAHTKYYTDNQIALEHLFLKGWDAVREIHAYPPATGAYAIYEKETFYSYFDYIGETFYGLDAVTVNPVFAREPFRFCVHEFGQGQVFPNLTWSIDFDHLQPLTRCLDIPKTRLRGFNSTAYLAQQAFEVPWDTIKWMKVNFSLETITYTQLGPLLGPECFQFETEVTFDNSDYDGQIPVELDIRPIRRECPHPKEISTTSSIFIQILNYAAIILCVISLILCCRALWRAQRLRMDSEDFFFTRYGWILTSSEKLEFLNMWYIVICVNDVFIIIGCIMKEMIETRSSYGDLWDFASLFLGIGALLVWIGMLRYLGFFKTYNVLILTLKGALPNVMRFLLCASLIYVGFVLCGWVVLGPYHFKFKSIMSTSECLYSLINGDDMFATFNSMPAATSNLVWGFSRIYLYTFISLFIYVILSLFIAIIMDTYDIIKEYYKEGWPKRRLHNYYQQARYHPTLGIFSPNLLQNQDEPNWTRRLLRRLVVPQEDPAPAETSDLEPIVT